MFYKGDMAQLYTHKNYYDYNLKSTLQTNQPGLKVNCSENEIVIKKKSDLNVKYGGVSAGREKQIDIRNIKIQ